MALQQAEATLADMELALGSDHPNAVDICNQLCGWRESLGQSGESA